MFVGEGWYVVMPMRIRDEMVHRHGSVRAALEAAHADAGSRLPLHSALTGAVGIDFVGDWASAAVERHRFPWCV